MNASNPNPLESDAPPAQPPQLAPAAPHKRVAPRRLAARPLSRDWFGSFVFAGVFFLLLAQLIALVFFDII